MAGRGSYDPEMLRYCISDAEKRYTNSLVEHQSIRAAAKAGGVSYNTIREAWIRVQNRAAKQGYSPDHDMVRPVPDTHVAKGVSTLYDKDGQVAAQWVKSSLKAENMAEALQEFVDGLTDDAAGKFKPVKAPKHSDEDLLTVYPMGDPHLGMLAYAEECGEAFDLKIAERDIQAAVRHLTSASPRSAHALVLNLGDFFHADNNSGMTAKSGNVLDVDTRWSKVLRVGARIMFWIVEQALRRHGHVTVVNRPGNHDEHSALFLSLILDAYFRNEPRVTVDTSPAPMWYMKHGKVLIGSTHGHGPKPAQLPGIMAHDRPEWWGQTIHRFWYTGHIHTTNRSEFPGVTWESFRTLAAKDHWHTAQGYRAGRDMNAIVMHAEHGEIGRHRADITRVRSADE